MDRFIALKPGKPRFLQDIWMKTWENNFCSTTEKVTEILHIKSQQTGETEQIIHQEMAEAIRNTKSSKAADSDRIFNEYRKDSEAVLLDT